MNVVVGHSEDIDSQDAIDEVLASCRKELDDVVPQAGILVASSLHDFEILTSAIMDDFPDLELVGCSTNGELSSIIGYAEDSVALILFQSDRVRITAGVGTGTADEPRQAAQAAVEMASGSTDIDSGFCVALPEAWHVSVRDVVDGLQDALGASVPIFGGASFNNELMGPSVQCYKREVLTDSVAVLLFSGPVEFSGAAESGWKPIGTRHRVTEADGNIVRTIDDRPAEDLFIQYFGGHSMFYPLAVYPIEDGPFYLATPAIVVEDGAIFFLNYVPTGSVVQFADATPEDIIEAAETSSDEAVRAFPGDRPVAGLIFSCAGRRAALGSRTAEEVELLRKRLGADVPVIGFYSGSELCPLKGQQTTQTHGFTFTTLLIGES
jgi:hypothetical protein